MEFVERFFGFKRRKQEKLIAEIGVSGQLKRKLIGPQFKEASVVEVDNDQFLQILKSGDYDEVISYLANRSDTHLYHRLYIDVGEDVLIETGVASFDYSGERNLFSDLREMSFKYDPKEAKDDWGVYRRKRA